MSARSLVPTPRGSDAVVAQAINDFQSEIAAVVGAPYPKPVRSTLYTLSAMVAVALILISVVKLDEVVTAPGKVVSRTPSIVVQPLDTSVVRSIMVRPGQEVKKGDLLVTLDPTFASADASQLRDQVASLTAEVARLEAEQAKGVYDPGAEPTTQAALQLSVWRSRQAEYKAKLANYDQKIESAQSTMVRSQRDMEYFKSRVAVTSEIEDMRAKLEKKEYGSRLNTLLAQDSRTEMMRNLASAEQQARSASHDLEALRSERDSFLHQWQADLAQDLSSKRTDLQKARDDLSKAERRNDLVEMRAIEDGSILSVGDISVGSVAKTGDMLVTLVPANAPLEAEVDLDGADQGHVKLGDKVEIKLDAYRFVEHGTAKGILRSVSDDSFTRQDNGQPTTRRFFRGRIEITEVKLYNVGKDGVHLVPGMPLSADIMVGRRTILMYLMETVLRQASEGMREP
ncbi:HlyD family type I secretion periplasmic adaptor subunit [Nitrospirillum viridazoti]|uniref:HlyD family type I secretion periplasmic adaptor subunit n=1 Tax=Nitrospirillum viridazoti TaxID=3144925 RepID=UPI0011AC7BB3|nr:HlyD family type I secretion periplasmic adaptor subunit [Nitrospirillum amazonense]TWB44673.1 HlyD family type I secretion membrane fusion protein [Nitrospirillum amazonense]